MANRYWVGGTANWDGTAGTKWSDTSGGSGGFSVPTTADDVFFSAGSTGTVTIATGNTGAKSITCTGFTGTLTGTAALTVAGSITLVAGMTYSYTGTTTFTGTGTLTTAGKSFGPVTVNAAGITLTLGDALSMSAYTLTLSNGSINTAGYNVTATAFSSSVTTTRTFTLGASTLSFSSNNPFTVNATNLTFNANTSQINFTNNAANNTNITAALTFYNVSFPNVQPAVFITWTGSSTFNNFTVTINGTGITPISLGANQTVNGTLSFSGSSVFSRGAIFSSVIGTTRTITAATLTANDCDFRDITIAGGASGTAPTRAGNCGNNSGITFPAAKNSYRVGANTTWAGSSSWATGSGGAGADSNFPLPQDTAIIDNSATPASAITLGSVYNCPALDCTNRTNAIGISYNAACYWYGSHTLGSGVTPSSTFQQTFFTPPAGGTADFTSAGKTITFSISVQGSFRLLDAFNQSGSLSLDSGGTLNANNYSVTTATFTSTTTLAAKTLTMGSALWTLSGTGAVWNVTATSLTFNKDTADILLSNTTTTARSFTNAAFTYNKLTIGGATGISTTTISGVGSFSEIASTKTVAHTITLATGLGTITTWSVKGTSGNVVTLNSSIVGTRRTFGLSTATTGIDYLAVKDIGVTQTDTFYVGANSTDNGNNSNVYFTATPIFVTGVAGTGAVGDVAVATDQILSVTGVAGTGAVGSITVTISCATDVTGVSATGQIGDVTVAIDKNVPVTGVEGTGAVGNIAVAIDQDVSVTGVEGTGAVGDVAVATDQVFSITGVSATGQLGDIYVVLTQVILVDGVEATGQIGDVVVPIDQTLLVTGVVGTGIIGNVLVWGVIPTPQTPNWTPIAGNASVWEVISTPQTPNWTEIVL